MGREEGGAGEVRVGEVDEPLLVKNALFYYLTLVVPNKCALHY